jgi:hypothetical protein
MQSRYLTMMAVKLGTLAFGHEVRPKSWGPVIDVRGDRIAASTRRKRAP